MSLERYDAQHHEVVDKYHDPAADYTMTTRDYVMRPTVAAAAITITLPLVHEAKGRFYSIVAKGNVTQALPVTIQDQDESEQWEEDLILYDLNQSATFYSDGLKWMLGPYTRVVRTSAQVVSMIRHTVLQLTMTGASAVNTVEALKVHLISDVQMGNWANAIYAKLDLQTDGYVAGIAGVVCAELDMPAQAGVASGKYSIFQAEVNCPTTLTTTGPIVILDINSWGGAKTEFDDVGLLMDINGVTSGSGDFWYESDITLTKVDALIKIRVNGTFYYIPVSNVVGGGD